MISNKVNCYKHLLVHSFIFVEPSSFSRLVGWLFWVKRPIESISGPFSLYRAISQREGERGERIYESKNSKPSPTRTYCKRNRPLPYCNQNCRTPRHWKFTQHHRTTRPPPLPAGEAHMNVRCLRLFL